MSEKFLNSLKQNKFIPSSKLFVLSEQQHLGGRVLNLIPSWSFNASLNLELGMHGAVSIFWNSKEPSAGKTPVVAAKSSFFFESNRLNLRQVPPIVWLGSVAKNCLVISCLPWHHGRSGVGVHLCQ
jgi:hypothetical protein